MSQFRTRYGVVHSAMFFFFSFYRLGPYSQLSAHYPESDAYALFADANLQVVHHWTCGPGSWQYSLWLLERPRPGVSLPVGCKY